MADRIVLMRKGVIEQAGTPLDLFERPANGFVAGFIGAPAMRFFAGVAEAGPGGGTAIRLDGGETLPMGDAAAAPEPGRRVRVGIRPEDVVPRGHGLPPQRGFAFTAPVLLSEPLGNETLLIAPFGGGEVTSRMYRPKPVRVGDVLEFAVDLDRLHLFDEASELALPRP